MQLPHVHTLNLAENDNYTNAGFRCLKNKELVDLDLSFCAHATGQTLRFICKKFLQRLVLALCNITDADLQHVHGMSKLQHLDLSLCTRVSDAGLVHLPSKLLSLSLKGTLVTDAGLVHLAKLFELCFLDLSYCDITDAGLAQVAQQSTLRVVKLTGNQFITDKGVQHLSALTELQEVDFSDCGSITEASIACLREKLPNVVVVKVL